MTDPVETLARHMVNRKQATREPYMLVLGAGASLSSGCSSYSQVVDDFLQQYCPDDLAALNQEQDERKREEGKRERFHDEWRRMSGVNRHAFLNRHLGGGPSPGYDHLAWLVRNEFMRLIFSTNLDNHVEQSFTAAGITPNQDYELITNGPGKGQEVTRRLEAATPSVKVIKLHGTLSDEQSYAWLPEEIFEFEDELADLLLTYLNKDVIILGHRMEDRDLDLQFRAKGGEIWLVNPSGASDTRFKAVLNVRAQSRVLTGDAARFDEFLASLHTHIEASENAAGVPERAQGSDSDQSEENKEDAAFDKWWGQIDAAWPGDKGLLDDHLWEEEPQRRDQRWKQVEAVLEEFAELMGRRAAVEIVCGDFWYLWDDEEPTSLHFIRRKLAEFRKALGGQECLPETRGNEGWYRMRWEGFTGGEGLLEDEHKRLQDAKAWGEEIGHIWHTPTQGYGEGKERLRHLRERENPDEIRASVAAGKPRELRIMFFGAFSRLAEERKQAWQRVKKQLESLNDAAAVTLAEIKRRWDDLLDGLRKDRRSALAAILREAVPVALEGDTLTLSFARKHEFHYTTLCKDEKLLKAASGALKHVFGREIAIKCQLESPNETATAADQPTG